MQIASFLIICLLVKQVFNKKYTMVSVDSNKTFTAPAVQSTVIPDNIKNINKKEEKEGMNDLIETKLGLEGFKEGKTNSGVGVSESRFEMKDDDDGIVGGRNPPLGALLGAAAYGHGMMRVGEQRVYVSAVETSIKLGKKTSVTHNAIAHKIERIKSTNDRLAASVVDSGGMRFEMVFNLNKNLAEEASRRIDERRGNAAINANFVMNDWSGILSRLTSAIGRYSQTGVLPWHLLTGGRNHIFNRDKFDGRIEEGNNVVYIPRVTGDTSTSDCWFAVIGAALGCGCIVVTDATSVDRNNRVMITPPSGATLVRGCMEGVMRMMAMMQSCNAGVLGAFACAKGAHSEMSVVGHTDEGGYMRDVWRRNRFNIPFGVIWVNGGRISSIPMPAAVNMVSASKFFDSIALYSAACSAVSDPLIENNNDWYPSIFTRGVTDDNIGVPGLIPDDVTLERWSEQNASAIYDACDSYCDNMSHCLDRMFVCSSDVCYLDKISGFMNNCFASLCSTQNRHLKSKSVTPFYWIEPQNLLGSEVKDMQAQLKGYGVFAFRDKGTIEVPALEKARELGESSSLFGHLYVEFTSLRKNLLFSHLFNNIKDGLAYFSPRQTREDGLFQVGARAGHDGTFAQRARAMDNVGDYMWRHPTCKLPAPGEFLQLQRGMSLFVTFGSYDEGTGYINEHFSASMTDLLGNIKVTPSQCQCVGIKNREGVFDRDIARLNALAAAALETNRGTMGRCGGGFTQIPISSTGAAPGINIVDDLLFEPRRLIVTGEDMSGEYAKFLGTLQQTVLSGKLRHSAKDKRAPSAALGQGGKQPTMEETGLNLGALGEEFQATAPPSLTSEWEARVMRQGFDMNDVPTLPEEFEMPVPAEWMEDGGKVRSFIDIGLDDTIKYVRYNSLFVVMKDAVPIIKRLLVDELRYNEEDQVDIVKAMIAMREYETEEEKDLSPLWLITSICDKFEMAMEREEIREWIDLNLETAGGLEMNEDDENTDGGEDA